jgi:hypothetical protein
MQRFSIVLLVVCIVLGASGCACWRSEIDPNAARYDDVLESAGELPQKSLLLTISASHVANEQEGGGKDCTAKYEKHARKWFAKTGLFAEVGTDVSSPDLELVLNIEERENFNEVLTVITGVTLLVVPTVDRVTFDIEGTVHSSSGSELGKVTVHEEVKVLIGWIALPAIPSVFIVGPALMNDLCESIMVQMIENRRIWR